MTLISVPIWPGHATMPPQAISLSSAALASLIYFVGRAAEHAAVGKTRHVPRQIQMSMVVFDLID